MDRRRRHSRRSQADLELRSIALKHIMSLLRTGDAVDLCRIAEKVKQEQSDTNLVSAIVNEACSGGPRHLSRGHCNFGTSHSSSTGADTSLTSYESPAASGPKIGPALPRVSSSQEKLTVAAKSVPTIPDSVSSSQAVVQPTLPVSLPRYDTRFFEHFADMVTVHQIAKHVLPVHNSTPLPIQSAGAMVQAITDLRELAQQSITRGLSVCSVIGSEAPDLTLLFRERTTMDTRSVWNWAGELAASYKCLSLSMQLAVLYLAGMQMRVSGSGAEVHWCADCCSSSSIRVRTLLMSFQGCCGHRFSIRRNSARSL